MPRVKMSRADHNPWLAKMFYWWRKPEYQGLAENDIITRGVTVKIQQVAVCGNYENPTNDAKGEDE
jgi:hypothetical protein